MFGYCRCCLKKGLHTTVNIQQTLECLNVEVSTDPRVSVLVCSNCSKFLQQASKFCDMVAASQTKLLNMLTYNCVNIDQVLNSDIEPDTNLVKVEKMEQEPDVFSDAASADSNECASQTADDYWMEDDGGHNELSDSEVLFIDEVNIKKLTINDLKLRERIMQAEMDSQIRKNLATILQHSTITPFTIAKGDLFECIYCNHTYAVFSKLRSHVKNNHNEDLTFKLQILKMRALKENTETILRADVSCIKCRLCDKIFTTIDKLVQHLANIHNIEYRNIIRNPAHNILCFDMSLSDLKCLDCGKTFTHFRGMLYHMNQHYGSYLCHDCGNKFLYEHTLRIHSKIHLEQERVSDSPCPVCNALFNTRRNLTRHVKAKHPKVTLKYIIK